MGYIYLFQWRCRNRDDMTRMTQTMAQSMTMEEINMARETMRTSLQVCNHHHINTYIYQSYSMRYWYMSCRHFTPRPTLLLQLLLPGHKKHTSTFHHLLHHHHHHAMHSSWMLHHQSFLTASKDHPHPQKTYHWIVLMELTNPLIWMSHRHLMRYSSHSILHSTMHKKNEYIECNKILIYIRNRA